MPGLTSDPDHEMQHLPPYPIDQTKNQAHKEVAVGAHLQPLCGLCQPERGGR